MISPTTAKTIIAQNKFSTKLVSKSLDEAFGYQLAEDLFADRDFPPFDRVMMDGFAVGNLSLKEWIIEQTAYAGQPETSLHSTDGAIEIMTGAPLPHGCQAIIPVEEIEIIHQGEKRIAKFIGKEIKARQFIHAKGSDLAMGELLIKKNTHICAIEIALAASIGKTHLSVYQKPKIALISTGDELIPISEIPLAHQIRSSNMPMLQAALLAKKYVCDLFHLPDDPQIIRKKLQEILSQSDLLILSGGVSAGKKDFIPEILLELGFECHFHKISQKPGKPMWFGTRSKDQKTIFALPGNPISTLVCFYSYFLPSVENKEATQGLVEITNPKPAHAGLDLWLPAKWKIPFQKAEILPNNGSGDMVAWREADIIIWQKVGDNSVHLPYIPLK